MCKKKLTKRLKYFLINEHYSKLIKKFPNKRFEILQEKIELKNKLKKEGKL